MPRSIGDLNYVSYQYGLNYVNRCVPGWHTPSTFDHRLRVQKDGQNSHDRQFVHFCQAALRVGVPQLSVGLRIGRVSINLSGQQSGWIRFFTNSVIVVKKFGEDHMEHAIIPNHFLKWGMSRHDISVIITVSLGFLWTCFLRLSRWSRNFITSKQLRIAASFSATPGPSDSVFPRISPETCLAAFQPTNVGLPKGVGRFWYIWCFTNLNLRKFMKIPITKSLTTSLVSCFAFFCWAERHPKVTQPKVSQGSQPKHQVKWLPRWLPPPPNLLLSPHPPHLHPQSFPSGFAARSARAFAQDTMSIMWLRGAADSVCFPSTISLLESCPVQKCSKSLTTSQPWCVSKS